MASVKVIFRASSASQPTGTLYYRIIHKRIVRQIHTGIHIARQEWDNEKCMVIPSLRASDTRREYLLMVKKKIRENLIRLECIIRSFERSGKEYTATNVVESYAATDTVVGFITFTHALIKEYKNMGNASAVAHYSSALNSFKRFHGEMELPFEEFDSKLMESYECYLKRLTLTPNTISYYMRKLRAVYNQAVDRGLTTQQNPFKHVYTGIARTKKRAVSIETIKNLRKLDLSNDPIAELARDMFLFSFYTRGMAIVDMSYLKKSNLQDGTLRYRRQKTQQLLSIHWEEKMEEIVNRHTIPGSAFLLPLIKSDIKDYRRQYQSSSHLINRQLKKLGRQIGLTEPLTMYRARHAWASIAHDNNVPISVISQGLGHDSEKTTRIYLESLETSVIDKANNHIICLLDS